MAFQQVQERSLHYLRAGKGVYQRTSPLFRVLISLGIVLVIVSAAEADDQENEEGSLVRAADLVGQLGDPQYLRKANALYYEFEEAGVNRQRGYTSPADLVSLYPRFYWDSAFPHIQPAIRYLNVTSNGRQWIANLHSNVFRAEYDLHLSGPQQ